jgi:hypothetical protein
VIADNPELLAKTSDSRISISRTHYMFVRLLLPSSLPAAVTWVTLHLTAPSGAAHLERHVPFALQGGETATMHGISHPINVEVAVPTSDGYALDMPILVGGSNLQRRPVLGDWTITASLDDQPESVARATVTFER